ncbi:hypothetical protein Gpo141_00004255 [Globisporangium polare]
MPGEQLDDGDDDGPRIILEKHEWLRVQEQVRHEQIVNVNQPMALAPCLYFGTRRCTYSDVVSIVTTVKPIPRLNAQHHITNTFDTSHPRQSSTLTPHKQHNGPDTALSPTNPAVAWAEKALASSKDPKSREPERPFVRSVSEACSYTSAPLEGDRHRKRRTNETQALALTTEARFFMTKLHEKRRERFHREREAALVVQRTYRGYLLRRKFHEMKTKLQVRKRIRVSLVKVTKGTAIITGEKDRRARILAIQNDAARKVQFQFRRWCALKIVAKERAGYQARQRVRRIRIHRQILAAQRIQWAFQRVHAEKARYVHHRRRRDELRHKAAIAVQRMARGYVYRARVLQLRLNEELSIRIACAVSVQRVVRGFLGRQYVRFQRAFQTQERAWRCALHATRIVRGFLARRAVQIEKVLQETDLLIQTRRGNLSTVIDLLDGYGAVDDQPADMTVVNLATKNNLLHLAAKHGHFEILTHVIPKILASSYPGMVYALNAKGESPLELAVTHHREKIAAYLLATTASLFDETVAVSAGNSGSHQIHKRVHKTSGRERSLLLQAARHGMGSIVTKLLLLFPHIFSGQERDSWAKRSILHEALLFNQTQYENPRQLSDRQEQILMTMTMILTKVPQVKINDQDFVGFTALHIAAQLGNLQAVRLLLEYGADVTIADAQARTAWRIALLQGHESCFLEIRRKWLDSVSSSSGINLALIAQDSSQELEEDRDGSSKALVNSAMRANRRAQQLHPQLETELVNACKAGNLDKVKFFIEEFQVSINATDRAGDGDSLLMIACHSANMPLIKFLIQQGGQMNGGGGEAETELLDVHYVNNVGKSALELATGNLSILNLLVTECRSLNLCHPFGAKRRSAAHEAARRGFHIRQWLNDSAVLTPGMLTSMTDEDGRSPLHDAAAFGHVQPAKTLINIGVSVGRPSERELRTPLHDACRAGNAVIVRRMLQQTKPLAAPGVIGGLKDADGRSSFFDAVISGSTDCVQLLLDAKTEKQHSNDDEGRFLADQVDSHGCGLLHEAVGNVSSYNAGDDDATGASDETAMIDFLIAKLPPDALHQQFPPKMLSPLHVAAIAGNAFAVERLLQQATKSKNSTRLDFCLRGMRDSDGELAIHSAARHGKLSVIDKFAAFGFDVNEQDAGTGNSLLHFAVQCAHLAGSSPSQQQQLAASTVTLTEALIQRGNSVTAFTKSGLQPLHLAATNPNEREQAALHIVRVLVKHKAPVDAPSQSATGASSTPIQLAIQHGNLEVAQYLRSILDGDGTS